MTDALARVSPSTTEDLLEEPSLAEASVEELAIVRELVRSARARGSR